MLEIEYSSQAKKILKNLIDKNRKFAGLIYLEIEKLLQNPKPNDCKKLTNKPYYRVRVGDFRIIYNFDKEKLFVILIDKRDKVYKEI